VPACIGLVMINAKRILPLTIAAALFMEQMDSTIIATSLPDIAKDLGTSPVSLKLAFTTYLLGLTVFLPISGWAADRFGAKTVFSSAIVVFTMASVACGFAQGLEWLVVARALQGIGGALMVPVGRIILLRTVEKKDLLDAIAWLTIPALIGPVLGPPIGGYITTVYDWRWIFWMNLPFGVLALGLALWLMPNVKPEAPPPLDVKGFFLSGGGLTLAVFGMTVAGQGLFHGWQVWAMEGIGLLLLALYVLHARRIEAPILDFRLFRNQTYRQAVLGGNIYRIAVGATPFLMPLLLQIGFGYTAFEAGLVTVGSAIGALLMKFTVAPLVRRFGYRQVLIFNGLGTSVLLALKGIFSITTPFVVMFGVLLLSGFVRSLQFSSLNTLAYADISQKDMAKANALYTVLQQLFLAVGVALAALMLDAQLWWAGREDLQAQDFRITLFAISIFALLAVPAYLKLDKGAGATISGRVDD
jgi:EmrB/QacA subfamily drug resistance transporter